MERNNNELPSSFNYHFSFNNKTTYDISHKFFRGLNQKNTVSTTKTVFPQAILDWGTPNSQKLGIALFVCPLILYVFKTI